MIPHPAGGCSLVVDVAVGGEHVCAVGDAGQVACWGKNENGQLGADPGAVPLSTRARLVGAIPASTAVAAGLRHSCALSQGSVWCWGAIATPAGGYLGQLGNGGDGGQSTPVQVPGLSDVTAVVAMAFSSCALLKTGEVRCWGFGGSGQLGNGMSPFSQLAPASPPALGPVTALAAGRNHACAIVGEAREVWCWGENVQLKTGSTAPGGNQPTPVRVGTLADASSLALGDDFSCAQLADATVLCWGAGAAADNCVSDPGPPPSTSCTPTAVPGLRKGFSASKIFGGAGQICGVLTSTGRVACFGNGSKGRLGDGVDHGIFFVQTPSLLVGPAEQATFVDFGDANGCALAAPGLVSCWGVNVSGSTGDGTQITSSPEMPSLIAIP
jgi:alpha-tubulin suppressor-like RCC1 family protein